VLSELRATGWLHYRPLQGKLERASSEPWAAKWTEGTHKMSPAFRANRESHVKDGKPAYEEKAGAAPDVLEENYFDATDALELVAEPDCLSQVEQRRLDAALLHPSVRKEVEAELAELALVTSQKPKKAKEGGPKLAKQAREEKVKAWRLALGGKAIAARLAALVPYSKASKKKVKKHLLKSVKGKLKLKKPKAKKNRDSGTNRRSSQGRGASGTNRRSSQGRSQRRGGRESRAVAEGCRSQGRCAGCREAVAELTSSCGEGNQLRSSAGDHEGSCFSEAGLQRGGLVQADRQGEAADERSGGPQESHERGEGSGFAAVW